jgi:hypothetical protein
MNNFLPTRVSHRIAAMLLIGSLAVRALVPLGYMPGNLLAGNLAELCPVASAATYTLLAAHDLHRHQHDGASGEAAYSIDSACPIGSTLFADALPAMFAPIDTLTVDGKFQLDLVARYYYPTLQPAYPARAPPVPRV